MDAIMALATSLRHCQYLGSDSVEYEADGEIENM